MRTVFVAGSHRLRVVRGVNFSGTDRLRKLSLNGAHRPVRSQETKEVRSKALRIIAVRVGLHIQHIQRGVWPWPSHSSFLPFLTTKQRWSLRFRREPSGSTTESTTRTTW